MKKKLLIVFTLIFLAFICVLIYKKFNPTNKKEEVNIILDSSTEFSEEELNKGVEEVLRAFNPMWKNSKLHEIRFDNKVYEHEMENRGSETTLFSDLDKNNVLIFTVSFTTGKKVEGSIGPNTPMDGWRFILTRKNKNSNWKYLDQGV